MSADEPPQDFGPMDYDELADTAPEQEQTRPLLRVVPPLQTDPYGPKLVKRHFFDWLSSVDMARPLPPIPWLCEGLEMAPGAPTLMAGYGGSGKSMLAQWLALSVASGTDFCDFRVRQGGVLHLDWEQGFRLTAERYQRMAGARALRLSELPISLATHPRHTLMDGGAETALLEACQGQSLCILDSLAVCSQPLDENSSEIRKPLDLLTRVSERTGCVFVMIHHARKTSQQVGAGEPDVRMIIRGSSGIFDACASVLALVGGPKKATTVHHIKARVRGKEQAEMTLGIRDTEDGWLELQLAAAGDEEDKNVSAEVLIGRIAAYVGANPGISKESIKVHVSGKRNDIVACLAAMVAEGLLRAEGNGVRGAPVKFWLSEK